MQSSALDCSATEGGGGGLTLNWKSVAHRYK